MIWISRFEQHMTLHIDFFLKGLKLRTPWILVHVTTLQTCLDYIIKVSFLLKFFKDSVRHQSKQDICEANIIEVEWKLCCAKEKNYFLVFLICKMMSLLSKKVVFLKKMYC